MKTIVVLEFDIPSDTEDNYQTGITGILTKLDPPSLPHFSGQARIAVGSDAQHVIDWLEVG